MLQEAAAASGEIAGYLTAPDLGLTTLLAQPAQSSTLFPYSSGSMLAVTTFHQRSLLLGSLLSLAFALPARAQLVAFPGAEGYGRLATGGRGGDHIMLGYNRAPA